MARQIEVISGELFFDNQIIQMSSWSTKGDWESGVKVQFAPNAFSLTAACIEEQAETELTDEEEELLMREIVRIKNDENNGGNTNPQFSA